MQRKFWESRYLAFFVDVELCLRRETFEQEKKNPE